jgi:rRNA processing protein Gar1
MTIVDELLYISRQEIEKKERKREKKNKFENKIIYKFM